MAKPWERLEKEPARAYASFQVYLNLPAHSRSVVKTGESIGKTSRHLEALCTRWSWVSRAAAWDSHVQQLDEERRAKAQLDEWEKLREMARGGARIAMTKAVKALAHNKKVRVESIGDVEKLTRISANLQAPGFSSVGSKAKTSGDDRQNAGDVTIVRSLKLEVIGSDGKMLTADDIKAVVGTFYDKPGDH